MHVYNIDLLKSSQKCIHICLYHKILTSSKKQQLVTLITFNYHNILLLYRFVLVLYYQNLVDAYQVILPLSIFFSCVRLLENLRAMISTHLCRHCFQNK